MKLFEIFDEHEDAAFVARLVDKTILADPEFQQRKLKIDTNDFQQGYNFTGSWTMDSKKQTWRDQEIFPAIFVTYHEASDKYEIRTCPFNTHTGEIFLNGGILPGARKQPRRPVLQKEVTQKELIPALKRAMKYAHHEIVPWLNVQSTDFGR